MARFRGKNLRSWHPDFLDAVQGASTRFLRYSAARSYRLLRLRGRVAKYEFYRDRLNSLSPPGRPADLRKFPTR